MIRSLTEKQENELIEKLAELEHDQWVIWSKSLVQMENLSDKRLVRWAKLWKPYAQLTEEQKEQDRVWARKSIQLIKELNLEIVSK
jgi:hypothetical protein